VKPAEVSKARQKNINKDWKGGSITPGERLYVDISSIKGESYGGSKFWELVVNDYSSYCWSYFLKRKGDLKNKLIDLMDELKDLKKTVKFLRLDDAGETFALEKPISNNILGCSLNLVGQEPSEMTESAKPFTEESGLCKMTRELWMKFEMDFGQNVHLQHHSMRIELSTRRHNNYHCN
jgi:hypothetical protein